MEGIVGAFGVSGKESVGNRFLEKKDIYQFTCVSVWS